MGSKRGVRLGFRWGLVPLAIPLLVGSIIGACGRAPLGENPILVQTECGDGLCSPLEGLTTCPSDCFCGDEVCSIGEDSDECSEDCPRGCGDGVCSSSEDAARCRADCSELR